MATQIKNSQEKRLSFRGQITKALSGMHFSQLKYRSWRTKAGMLLVVAAIISGFATYAALNEAPPFGDDPNLVIWLLNADLIILLLLVSLIAQRIVSVWSGKRKGIAGSHLHVRLVYTFSILVAVPTIAMTVFSAFFFHFGVQAWFNQRVQTAINESQAVAESYLEEHKNVIRADTLAMANDLDRQANRLILDEQSFSKMLDTQSFFRNLSEAIVIEKSGRVLAQSGLTFTLAYEPPSEFQFQNADVNDAVLIMSETQDRVRALVRLQNFTDTYLFVGRMIDPEVLGHLSSAKMAVEDYNMLRTQFSGIQITVTMIFVVVALLLLLAAIWSGLLLARQLVLPIGELINASERVRAGDFSSKINEKQRLEEFEYLARSFNRMTTQIQTQRNDLIEATQQIDRRRRLTETVLSGVSSGVIGVDHFGTINLANHSAAELLGREPHKITGQYILDVIPEISDLLDDVAKKPKKVAQEQIPVTSVQSGKRIFLFRASIEILEENASGLIITFDDITELQSAQRKAAWSDVARRIAHEIKNPLTPIQLSAERLQRKYAEHVDDQDSFAQCTDTIIKHVGDIGKMVDEFSSFARMPEPVLIAGDITKHIKDSLILAKQAHTNIKFNIIKEDSEYLALSDAHQIRQVMTNLLKNAADSIDEKFIKNIKSKSKDGVIDILLGYKDDDEIFIAISDNGNGFPKNEDIAKLTEPYVTHKEKGTGLGLAIVKKIIEDHNGNIVLDTPPWLKQKKGWNDKGGACVVLTFPKINIPKDTKKKKAA